RQALVRAAAERLGERSHAVLPGERQAGDRPAHRPQPPAGGGRGPAAVPHARRGRVGAGRGRGGVRVPRPRRPRARRGALRPGPRGRPPPRADAGVSSVAILGYHKVGLDAWETWFSMPEETFAAQLEQLRHGGWQPIDRRTFLRGLDDPHSLPPRAAL